VSRVGVTAYIKPKGRGGPYATQHPPPSTCASFSRRSRSPAYARLRAVTRGYARLRAVTLLKRVACNKTPAYLAVRLCALALALLRNAKQTQSQGYVERHNPCLRIPT
jgi:hypothetical protein